MAPFTFWDTIIGMTLPFLDLRDPSFSTRSDAVRAARDIGWSARTPFGFAVLRHREAGQILRDRRFRQGSHAWPSRVALTGSFADFWTSSVIAQEGSGHKLQRQIALDALAPEFIEAQVPAFEEMAKALTAGLGHEFEFVEAFSEPFAGRAIAHLLGLPLAMAQEIAEDASTLGLAMGIDAKQHEQQVNAATDRLMDLADALLDRVSEPEIGARYVGRLAHAADRLGVTDRELLKNLVVISIFGGVDTTRAQLAFAAGLFADHPDQWDWLRKTPDAVPQAIDEVIRHRPTTTWATREAIETVEIDGVRFQAGDTVHLLVNATSTDPLSGHDGAFDIRVRRKLHFGFGGGAHHCLGQLVARTDMAAALRVMLRHVERFEWAGTPVYLPDSGNTSPVSLPIRIITH